MRLRLTVAAVVATGLLACAGCSEDDGAAVDDVGPGDFPQGSTMADLAEQGSMTVGTRLDQPLFGQSGQDGAPEGFDVEIAKIIAGRLGIPAENIDWVEAVPANREELIVDGEVDIVVATYTINEERRQQVDFAGPYYVAGQSILVLQDNDDIRGPDDLADRLVCTVNGSPSAETLRARHPTAVLSLTDTYSDCLDPLRTGRVDAISTDNVTLAGFIDQNPDEFKLLGEPFTEESYGIGLANGDDRFRAFINDALEESYEDGSWERAWERTAGAVLDTPEPPPVDRY